MTKRTEDDINEAFLKVEAVVAKTNNASDIQYFNFHKKRYLRMVRSVISSFPAGATILNIGSHYLHTSLLFKFLGYEVHSMDVEIFWDLDFISERQNQYDLIKIIDNNLESFSSHDDVTGKYDLVLFAEILEHITFNPIEFWKKIYRIVKSSGVIYISTPNSLNLYNICRTFARIVTLRGIGLPVGSIFQNVTYGHHWKEYSVSEIKKYFSILSNDFKVRTSLYHYRVPKYDSFYGIAFSVLSFIGNLSYIFSDEIEAIVEVEKTDNWKINSPEY